MFSASRHTVSVYVIIGLMGVLLGLVVVTSRFAMSDGQDITIVTDKDNGRQIEVAKGSTLVVRLEATPGTGHGWQVMKINADLLQPIGEPRFENPRQGEPGAVEQQVFRFKAQASGSTVLEMHYRRPWEKDVPPLRTYDIRLTIR